MDQALVSLLAANIAFVGTHFALSHPLRAPLQNLAGERGFLALYTAVSFAALIWIVIAFRAAGPDGVPLWTGAGELRGALASGLTLLALGLVIAAGKGNPAGVGMGTEALREARETGAFAVTRHPMMWGIAIWAVAHILVMPVPRTLITAGSMAFLALVGAHLQDRKKRALLGDAWQDWESRTSFWPRFQHILAIKGRLWLLALILWLALTRLHNWLGTAPVGSWH